MKIGTRPSTGIVTVTLQTAQGERTISTGTKDPKEAKALIKATNIKGIEVLAKAGPLTQQLIQKLAIGGNISVEEAISKWETWLRDVSNSDRTADNHVMYARAWARDERVLNRKINTIKEGDISNWINAKDGTKFGSRRVKLAAVRSLFKFCSIREWTMGDPSREVRVKAKLLTHEEKEPRQKIPFTYAEFNNVVEYLRLLITQLSGSKLPATVKRLETARFWYCAALIGRYAGLRMGDICSLEWATMKKPGKLIVWTDKKDTRVELPIDDRLAVGIASIPTNNRKLCFPEQDELARSSKRYKLSVEFGRILQRAGVSGHSFHDLRHTLATELNAKGDTIEAIAEALGHTSTKTTEGYIH